MSEFSKRAMLCGLHISQFTGRKRDKEITREVNDAHNAARDAGNFHKRLLPKAALAKINSAVGAAREEHEKRTLPWADDGLRILTAKGYFDYGRAMSPIKAEFDSAVRDFIAGYDSYVAEARHELNGMFKDSDYPSAAELPSRFSFRWKILPAPDAGDFRVEIGDAEAEAIRADIEARNKEATQDAMRDAWRRVAERVGLMADKLAAYKPAQRKGDKAEGIFRDSLVENVRELVSLLPALNVTNDPRLDDIAARMARELCTVDAEGLRESDSIRAGVAAKAEAIVKDISAYL